MKGAYTGTKTLTYKINPINISTCKVSISGTSYTYDGKAKTPTVTVKNASGTTLTKDTHYTVSYSSGRINVGTYKVTVTMKGNYSGSQTFTYTINPPKTSISSATADIYSIKVAYTKKTTQVTGYQIQYSVNSDFSDAITKTITSYNTTSATLSELEPETTYYVRVRTYKTVSGTKYYSGWSSTVKSTTKEAPHVHSYSAVVTPPTCSERGYTTYTCACGYSYVANYTNIVPHNYSNYICTMCGEVDKAHSYEYLVEWVKRNGKNEDDYITYTIQEDNSSKFTISYSVKYDNLFVSYYMNPGTSTEAYAALWLDSYFYGFSFYGDNIYGYVNAATYSESKSLTYELAECTTFTPDRMLPLAKTSVDLLIESLRYGLLKNELPITIADLGFKSY